MYSKYFYSLMINKLNSTTIETNSLYFNNLYKDVIKSSYKSHLFLHSLKSLASSMVKLYVAGLQFFALSTNVLLMKTFFIFNRKLIKYFFLKNYFNINRSTMLRSDLLDDLSILFYKNNIKGLILIDYGFFFRMAPILTNYNFYVFAIVPVNYRSNWVDFPLLVSNELQKTQFSAVAFGILARLSYVKCKSLVLH